MLIAMKAQRPGAQAKLIGERAQIAAGSEVLVNRCALAMVANRTHALQERVKTDAQLGVCLGAQAKRAGPRWMIPERALHGAAQRRRYHSREAVVRCWRGYRDGRWFVCRNR